ncbi:MAG: hypothetical protein U0Z17_09855 [Bacteroidales bacterium]|jgi:hypothetical protein
MTKSLAILHWTPRILCILAIAFISIFAFDAFEPGLTIWQQLAAFAMHLLPSFILFMMLVVAWRWELVGGIVFMLLGLGLSPFIYTHNYAMNHSVSMSLGIIMMITFPFFLVGLLFVTSYLVKKKQASQD